LLYNNDIICYDYFQNRDTYEKEGFGFQITDDSLSLTKILLSIIEDYDRTSSPINDITFDYYIQKTFFFQGRKKKKKELLKPCPWIPASISMYDELSVCYKKKKNLKI